MIEFRMYEKGDTNLLATICNHKMKKILFSLETNSIQDRREGKKFRGMK